MKKAIKYTILIALGLLVLGGAVLIINVFPLLSMKPVETGKIPNTEIYAIKNRRNNVFVIKIDNEYTLIDAGSDITAIKESLGQLSIDIANIKYVQLTHTDSDHVASLSLFPNAEVYISEDEKQMINGKVKRNSFGFNSLPKEVDVESLILLTDNQELKFGEHTIQCIKIPGHTLGSMAYFLDGKYLFTGDSIKIENGNISIHPFTMDENSAKASITRINDLQGSCQLILSSHYGYIENNE